MNRIIDYAPEITTCGMVTLTMRRGEHPTVFNGLTNRGINLTNMQNCLTRLNIRGDGVGRNEPGERCSEFRVNESFPFPITRYITPIEKKEALKEQNKQMEPMNSWIRNNHDMFEKLRPNVVCNRHILKKLLIQNGRSLDQKLFVFMYGGAVFIRTEDIPEDSANETTAGRVVEERVFPKENIDEFVLIKHYSINLLVFRKNEPDKFRILFSAEIDGFGENDTPMEVKTTKNTIEQRNWLNWYFHCLLGNVNTLIAAKYSLSSENLDEADLTATLQGIEEIPTNAIIGKYISENDFNVIWIRKKRLIKLEERAKDMIRKGKIGCGRPIYVHGFKIYLKIGASVNNLENLTQ